MDLQYALVTWVDAESHPGWIDSSDIKTTTAATVYTVGWVVRQDDQLVAVAQSTSRDEGVSEDHLCTIQYIPRAMVRKVKPLRDPRPKKERCDTCDNGACTCGS